MTCLSDYAIDRLVADEPREGSAAHVAGCERCAAELLARRGEREQFSASAPPLRAVAARRAWRAWLAAPVVAAAAVVVALGVARDGGGGGTRTKGGRVKAFVRHDGVVRAAARREAVVAGDAVQLTVTLAERRWVAVIGVDGAGRETVYREPAPVEAGVDVPLEFSIVLDDTRGEERLGVLFCDGPAREGCVAEDVVLVK